MKKDYLGFLLFALIIMFVSCNQDVGSDGEIEKTVKLNFTVLNNEGGTLNAKVGDEAPTTISPIKVSKGQEIIFTATPNEGYEVENWQGAIKNENDNNTAKLKIEKN